jgi:hypothetical protein
MYLDKFCQSSLLSVTFLQSETQKQPYAATLSAHLAHHKNSAQATASQQNCTRQRSTQVLPPSLKPQSTASVAQTLSKTESHTNSSSQSSLNTLPHRCGFCHPVSQPVSQPPAAAPDC